MILEKSDLEVIIKSLGKNGYVNLAGAIKSCCLKWMMVKREDLPVEAPLVDVSHVWGTYI